MEKLNLEKEKTLNRLRFGEKGQKLIITLVFVGIYILFSRMSIEEIVNRPQINPFTSSIMICLIGLFAFSNFVSIISMNKTETRMNKLLLYSFVISEPFVFIKFDFFSNIDLSWGLSLINPTFLIFIITILLYILAYSHFKKDSLLERMQIKNSTIFNLFTVFFGTFLISTMMVTFYGEGMPLVKVFSIKNYILIGIGLMMGIQYLTYSRRIFNTSINLTKQSKPKNGDFVYFEGYCVEFEEISEEMSFLSYRYTERISFHKIKNSKKEYLVINIFPSKNWLIHQKILPGKKIEVLGKYLKLRRGKKQIDFIEPYRINILPKKGERNETDGTLFLNEIKIIYYRLKNRITKTKK